MPVRHTGVYHQKKALIMAQLKFINALRTVTEIHIDAGRRQPLRAISRLKENGKEHQF